VELIRRQRDRSSVIAKPCLSGTMIGEIEALAMVDGKFRSYRNRDTVAREGSEQTSRGGLCAGRDLAAAAA
jgi:hypothetical protein